MHLTEGVNRGVAAPLITNNRHSDRKRYGTERAPSFRELNVVRGFVIIMREWSLRPRVSAALPLRDRE